MKINSTKINPAVLTAAVSVLSAGVPELTASSLIAALKEYGEEKKNNEQRRQIPEFLTIAETAKALGVCRHTVYAYIGEGKLQSVRASKRLVRVTRDSLLALVSGM